MRTVLPVSTDSDPDGHRGRLAERAVDPDGVSIRIDHGIELGHREPGPGQIDHLVLDHLLGDPRGRRSDQCRARLSAVVGTQLMGAEGQHDA